MEEYQNIQCYPSDSVQDEIIIAMDGMISKKRNYKSIYGV